jgi:hypothetical protein
MKALFICPHERPAVAALSEATPLVLAPLLGKTLIEYWIEHAVVRGATSLLILATDRPEQVRALVGSGERWGLEIEVIPAMRELTPAEARAKYQAGDGQIWLSQGDDVVLLDHLPQAAQYNLFSDYAGWYAALQFWLPNTESPYRIGLRQVRPGVWIGLRSQVDESAELVAPCWIGDDVHVGPGAKIGPHAVIENNSIIERGVGISHAVVGPEIVVGEAVQIRDSLAWGRTLVNWRLGSHIKIPDDFLICPLRENGLSSNPGRALGRIAALLAIAVTLPLALVAALRSRIAGLPVLRARRAARPRVYQSSVPGDTLLYYELTGADGWLQRWPQLWNIALGEFAWVGNRPLAPDEASWFSNEFERLWLAAPVGFFSLADAESCFTPFSDEAIAHASFYAAEANWRLDLSILSRAFAVCCLGARNNLPNSEIHS